MKNYLFLTLALAVFLGGCEERMFELTIYPYLNESFLVNESYSFEESGVVTADDIQDAAEISEEAQITQVEITSIRVILTPQEGNEISQLSIEANVITPNNDIIPILEPTPTIIDLPNQAGGELVLTDINSSAVFAIRQKVNDYLTGVDLSPFVLQVKGETTDFSEEKLILGVNVSVNFSVVYEECIEVPLGLGGEECI